MFFFSNYYYYFVVVVVVVFRCEMEGSPLVPTTSTVYISSSWACRLLQVGQLKL